MAVRPTAATKLSGSQMKYYDWRGEYEKCDECGKVVLSASDHDHASQQANSAVSTAEPVTPRLDPTTSAR